MKIVQLENETPLRLDIALAQALGISRNKLQQAIKAGKIVVDGQVATPHAAVTKENVITIEESVNSDAAVPTGKLPLLHVLYEDDDVVVLNKQAGVLVHQAQEHTEFTIADALVARYPSMADAGDDSNRAGLVHRLDRQASGVLLAAKSREGFRQLKAQFADRLTKKKYTVLVLGKVRDESGTIAFPIARSASYGRMAARPQSQEGREAVTHYDVLERFPQCTLLDVTIETGRTHQIRAHFFAMQHPVAGDTLYVQRGMKAMNLDRLFLHARELTVTLPSGEEKTFIAPLASELETFVGDLRTRYTPL